MLEDTDIRGQHSARQGGHLQLLSACLYFLGYVLLHAAHSSVLQLLPLPLHPHT